MSLLTPDNIHRPALSQPDEISPAGILLVRGWLKRTYESFRSRRSREGCVVEGESAEVIKHQRHCFINQ